MAVYKLSATSTLALALLCASGCVVTTYDPYSQLQPPEAPVIERTAPASPSASRTPRIFGKADADTLVQIFVDGQCGGIAAGEGTAEELATIGIVVAVQPNVLNKLVAVSISPSGILSPCSAVQIPYGHDDQGPAFAGAVTATPVSPSQVVVTWAPATDAGAAGGGADNGIRYELCVGAAAPPNACAPFVVTHAAAPGGTMLNVGGLDPNTAYVIIVRAKDALGNTTEHATKLTPKTLPIDAQGVAAGAFHTCALSADGGAKCWGWNFSGQLGVGYDTERSASPIAVPGLLGARSITAGGMHTCALLGDKTVQCWGDDDHGQLGGSSLALGEAPATLVKTVSGAVAVSAGLAHTCALLSSGGVRCWGDNSFGQLGDGTIKRSAIPVTAQGVINAVALVSGDHHTCALIDDGTARCWGGNASGELGDGSNAARNIAVKAIAVEKAIALTGGWAHTCALDALGKARCWGKNEDGQLGDGSKAPKAAPTAIEGLASAVTQLVAGWNHSCALLADKTVACFGRNADGQLGDGTDLDRSVPAVVQGLSNVSSLAAGESHTCARLEGGDVRCWGRNDFGQVGDGTLNGRAIPAAAVAR